MDSKLFSVNLNEIWKGAVVAIFGAVINSLYQLFSTCVTFSCLATFNWGELVQSAILVGLAYITKKFLSDSQGKILGKI